VLVYAGAIMVLFLFVIMLLNLSALPSLESLDWKTVAGFVVAMVVLAQLVYMLASGLGALPTSIVAEQAAQTGDASNIAKELFTRYALTFEVIGVLLLVATIGALLLAKRKPI